MVSSTVMQSKVKNGHEYDWHMCRLNSSLSYGLTREEASSISKKSMSPSSGVVGQVGRSGQSGISGQMGEEMFSGMTRLVGQA